MTYSVRCEHGELYAVCRTCEWHGWPDQLYVDEEPWPTAVPYIEPRRQTSTLILLAVLGMALLAVIVWSRS